MTTVKVPVHEIGEGHLGRHVTLETEEGEKSGILAAVLIGQFPGQPRPLYSLTILGEEAFEGGPESINIHLDTLTAPDRDMTAMISLERHPAWS
ncbi:hypothetical protein [Brevibacterium moorei]|uniref:hypothetical protein n=1 Tax=Brevibacterium moorei TaxID=2968457 RepID=UPI00211CD506|nr:hypothetical protein [Brevibacterium sp. 68QC2CO]MCQ9384394.1 hypothetical protein [Brevibacterium sp. 68QC2CO]